jgi:hypothetical protein
MIESGILTILDEDGINNTIERINLCKDWWFPRGIYGGKEKKFAANEDNPIDFYTIGAATYMDDSMMYAMIVEETAPMMKDYFEWLYGCLLYHLTNEIGPCQINEELAPPGFHIFAAKPDEEPRPASKEYLERPCATIHYDEQHRSHKGLWSGYQSSGASVDLENTLSFTLCLAAPETGAGLSTWEEDSVKCYDRNDKYSKHIKSLEYGGYGSPDAVIPYTPGKMFYWIGPLKHQMSPGMDLKLNDKRITLQGHGVKVNDCWELYF